MSQASGTGNPLNAQRLNGARCTGLWWLFDSTDPDDHLEARQVCADCPAILACRELLTDVRRGCTGGKGSGPVGTWGGLFIGQRRAVCGTPSGYYRHVRTRREPACEDCKAAHRRAESVRQARQKGAA